MHILQFTQQLVLFVNGFIKASGFTLGHYNFLQSLALDLKHIRNLYLSKVLSMNFLKNEELLQTHVKSPSYGSS